MGKIRQVMTRRSPFSRPGGRPCRLLRNATAAALLFLPGASLAQPPAPTPRGAEEALVIKVFDGDTLRVRIGDARENVRLLGVDCPEVSHPSRPVEFLGEEATALARKLADGEKITLEADPLGDDRDSYERLLRYVTLPDGRMLNRLLIEEGFCYALTRFQFTRRGEFSRLEGTARKKGLGLWEDGGLAELRWIEGRNTTAFAVYPMTRRTWGVRFRERVRVRLNSRELQRALEKVLALSAELEPSDLDFRLEREGWSRIR